MAISIDPDPDPGECEVSIIPGPGACCPDQHFVDGVCTGCGCILSTCRKRIYRACIMEDGQPGCLGRLDCEGYETLESLKCVTSGLSKREYRKAMWEQKLEYKMMGLELK